MNFKSSDQKEKKMIYLRSVMWSLSYPILLLFGYLLGEILYFIYTRVMFLQFPDFVVSHGPVVVSGIVGGLISGGVIAKYAKNLSITALLIVPALTTFISLYGSILVYRSEGELLTLIVNIGVNLTAFGIFTYIVTNNPRLKLPTH